MNKKSNSRAKPAAWLIGTWRSDKKRTVEAWGKYPPGSAKFRRMFIPDLGKLTVSYGAKKARTKFDEVDETVAYRVVWQSNDTAFVVFGEKRKHQSGQLIHFDTPTSYWVHCGRFVEYFSKVKRPNNQLQPTRETRAPERRRYLRKPKS